MALRPGWLVALALSGGLCAALAAPPRSLSSRPGHAPVLLPRPEVVRTLGRAVLPMVVDYYWLQTIQQVGRAQTVEEYRDVAAYAELVSDLDPRFRQVYVFSAAVIAVSLGDGKFANTAESTRVLEKGVRNVPDHFFMRIMLAYNYSTYHGRYREAADQLAQAARLPGAPPYLGPLATRLYARAGDVDAGLVLAETLAEEAEDEETREAFEQRVRELHLERLLAAVDAAAARYRAREGRPPADVGALVRAGDLPGRPIDPLGGTILLGPDGRARSSAQQRRVSEIGGETRSPSEATP